jgi:hypothetical protein
LLTDADGDCGKDSDTGESRGGIKGNAEATAGSKGGVGNCSLDIKVPLVVGRLVSSSSSSSECRSE